MVEKWLIYHSKENGWFFYSVPLFIVRYKLQPWQELTYHTQKRWCKKVNKVLNYTFGIMNQIRRVKGSMLTFMARSPSFSDSCKRLKKNTIHQNPPSSWAIRQWYKNVRDTGSSKGKRKAKRRAFRTVIQHQPRANNGGPSREPTTESRAESQQRRTEPSREPTTESQAETQQPKAEPRANNREPSQAESQQRRAELRAWTGRSGQKTRICGITRTKNRYL